MDKLSREAFANNIEKKLDTIACLLKSQVLAGKDLLTIDELAMYSGLAKLYIYKLTSQRKIPFYKPRGKQVYFKRTEIDQWLTTNRVATNEEIQTEVLNSIAHNRNSI